jgi:nucleotidyltransferase/DNA polymerase involved in DNA repair/S1-C subfamily serine protease
MFALVDANSFYCSAEQVFRPDLRGKPIVILSNNDGCIVASNRQAKELGIPKFSPYFKVQKECELKGVIAFSSNYELYSDLSSKMMNVIGRFAPEQFVYSIDESFLSFERTSAAISCLIKHGQTLRKAVWKECRLPVCVGFGSTLTLAKLANHLAKKNRDLNGVCLLESQHTIEQHLKSIDVGDVWGIGRRLTKRMQFMGINTAYDLMKRPPALLRKDFNVEVERTCRELNGEICKKWDFVKADKQQIFSTRSVGERITEIDSLRQALVKHAGIASRKAICISTLVTGCNSTPDYRKVLDNEINDYRDTISDFKVGNYSRDWVQPRNKSEKCEILFEGYLIQGIEKNSVQPEVEWDGNCKNGKADGVGKISSMGGSVNFYEIAYHNQGVTDQFFYKWTEGTNQVTFGRYVHENQKIVKLISNNATVKPNGDIDTIYSMFEQNMRTGVSKGVAFKQYSDGVAKYTGEFGNLLFFGARESFDSNNTPTFTFWGYYDVTSDKPDNYVILKNQQGVWHQRYQFGGVKEYVQLPQSYNDSIDKVTFEATKSANNASSIGQLALAMKKKYDASINASEVVAPEPSKTNEESEKRVSTGTGFFISNDGYVLTNSHVIEGSSNISIILKGKSISATLIDHDPNNDIALLKVNKSVEGLPIELKKKTKQGTDIAVLGYPNVGLQGNEQKATFGYINANSGIMGDTRYFQISSPIQPGNSGSPMLNEQGIVIGIASASLNQTAALETTGSLAQNVNYAVKIAYALPMLINHGVEYIESSNPTPLEKTQLIESISDSVVLVVAK